MRRGDALTRLSQERPSLVEQKNGAIVRRLIGYGRLDGLAAAEALARLYSASRLQTNLFLPSFKLREKKRLGARVIKRYHDPVSPASRVLNHPAVPEVQKATVRNLLTSADPVLLLGRRRRSTWAIARQRGARSPGGPHRSSEIDGELQYSLAPG